MDQVQYRMSAINETNVLIENEEQTGLQDIEEYKIDYGEIKFQGYNNKIAKYVAARDNEDEVFFENLENYLYSPNGFNLPKPKLIISVTGGAKNFTISDDTRNAFKLGLMKVALSTNAWIITGGTNTGCMRLVGDAIDEDLNGSNVTALGIASWNRVKFKKVVKQTELNEDDFASLNISQNLEDSLNPCHTSFVFVGNSRDEIRFRAILEERIKSTQKIPVILIVLEGGAGTLKTIKRALENCFPVLVVAGTRGCADLMKEVKYNIVDKKIVDPVILDQKIDDILTRFPKLKEKAETKTSIKNILINRDIFESCVNVFSLQQEENETDIEPIILRALSGVQEAYHMIILAIKWNRLDVAKNEFRKIEIEKQNSENVPNNNRSSNNAPIGEKRSLTEQELDNIFEQAVLENRPQFVELILKTEFNLLRFLSQKKLLQLYNNATSSKKRKYKEPFWYYLRHKCNKCLDESLTFENIRIFLENHFETLDTTKFLPTDEEDGAIRVLEPELNLFFWGLLTNRIEVAKVFWRFGKDQICLALIASKLMKNYSSFLIEDKTIYENYAKDFEDKAIGILDVFERNTRDVINDVLVIRYIDLVKMDCLQLADDCKCKEFLSHRVAQKALEDIWSGNDGTEDLIKTEEVLRNSQKFFNQNSNYIFSNNNIYRLDSNAASYRKAFKYLFVPKVKFYANFIFYLLFLLFFTTTMLFSIEPLPEENFIKHNKTVEIKNTENTSNSTETTTIFSRKIWFPIRETLLCFWIISLFLEEIRQFFFSKVAKYTFKYKFLEYIKNEWNWLDIAGCTLFFVGYIMLLFSLMIEKRTKEFYVASRICLSYDLGLWYVRILQFFLVSEIMGPKLLMIKKMCIDLMYFLLIIATFLIAFGVTTQALMDPYKTFSFQFLHDIIDKAYWPIYGELRILEKLEDEECGKEGKDPCLDTPRTVSSYILLMVYMLIASVLLLNLLIAMFSSTFEKIQTNSDTVWKNQNYSLISEYVEWPIPPPPFNFMYHIWNRVRNTISDDTGEDQIYGGVLIKFEQKCTEEMLKSRANKEHFENTNERLEKMEKQLNKLLKMQQIRSIN